MFSNVSSAINKEFGDRGSMNGDAEKLERIALPNFGKLVLNFSVCTAMQSRSYSQRRIER
jgi:hypothetical protein